MSAVPLDKPIAVYSECNECTCTAGHYTDSCETVVGVSISWLLFDDEGNKLGGAYASHEAAALTILAFPEVLRGCRIRPARSRRLGPHRYAYEPLDSDEVIGPPPEEWIERTISS